MKFKCILDCDPGHDDAMAIMLLGKAPNLECLGITTVSGNQTIEKTTINAIQVCEYLGLDYKVYMGSDKPLKREKRICSEIHGDSGLVGFKYKELDRTYEEKHAVDFIVEMCQKYKDIILIPTGPLTNIAKALIKDPSIKKNINKIVLMGGAINDGNITKYAEFNILVDPEAADIVFNSGLNIYMVGLNVTRRSNVTHEMVEEFNKEHTRGTDLFIDLMIPYLKNQKDVFNLDAAPLHDPLTVAWLIDNSILTFKKADVTIECKDKEKYGRTYTNFDNPINNTYVAVDVASKKYFELIKKYLIEYK